MNDDGSISSRSQGIEGHSEQATYSKMSHSQLMRVVENYDELSEQNRHVLRQELATRGLELLEQDESAFGKEQDQLRESDQLVTVSRYRDIPEAIVARSILEEAGIYCILRDENTVRMDWMWSNMIGGMRLQVPVADEQRARELLAQPMPETIDFEREEDFEQPVCPKCGSFQIKLNDPDRKMAAASMLIGLPLPYLKAKGEVWRCETCGCVWTNDEEGTVTAA